MVRIFILGLCLVCALQARAQHFAAATPGGGERANAAVVDEVADLTDAAVFYVVERDVRIYSEPDGQVSRQGRLNIRDAVRVLVEEDGWSLVEWSNRRGYVRSEVLSNLWIRIDKSERLVYVYEGTSLVRTYPADVSMSDEDKVRLSGRGEQDHYRIPEGVFFVARLNNNSRYYRALVINYPNRAHAARGFRDGLISTGQYQAIASADLEFREPPMNTPLGGMIEIHGNGSGRQRMWTRGCVALRNVHMSELWDMVHVGTPVIIER